MPETPAGLLALLRDAERDPAAVSGELLGEVYYALCEWERAAPDDDPEPGVAWSEALALLYRVLAARPDQESFAVFAAHAYGLRLDREGRRDQALSVLERAAERHAADPYQVYLLLEVGTLLRDEHEFGRALTTLRGAERRIEALRASGDAHQEAVAESLDALVTLEIAAAFEQLGMTDVAQDRLAEGERKALALDDSAGPPTWGTSLVYNLNFVIDRRLGDARALGERYATHPWAKLLPEETDRQVRVRLAIVDVQRAFAGEAPPGAGEAEIRGLLAEGLKPDEEVRARLFLATSLCDRGALDEASQVLAEARLALGEAPAYAPLHLFALGLEARLLRARGGGADDARALLEREVEPAFRELLERASRGPIEEAGIALYSFDWVEAFVAGRIEFELAADPGGRGAERALGAVLELQAQGTFAREHGIEAPPLDEVVRFLCAGGAGVCVLAPGREHAYLFLVDPAGVAVHRLAGTQALAGVLAELQDAIAAALSSGGTRELGGAGAGAGSPVPPHASARLEQALARASEALLPPAARARLSAWSHVRVAGLDAFGYAPFEALAGPSGPLGLSHAVSYLPSVPIGAWLERRARDPEVLALAREGAAVALVARGGVPGTLDRIDVGADALGVDALARGRATRELVSAQEIDQALAGAALVHVVAHGRYDADRPRPAGIVLAPSLGVDAGTWHAEEVEALRWPPLVLISACGTARGRLRRGDDGAGYLRSSFFRSGTVAAATATLPLDLAAATAFARDVHAELARGATVAEAFLAARRAADPARHGVAPIHACLLHVWGAGDLRVAAPGAPPAEPAAPAGSLPLAAGVAALVAAAAGVAVARTARRGARRE